MRSVMTLGLLLSSLGATGCGDSDPSVSDAAVVSLDSGGGGRDAGGVDATVPRDSGGSDSAVATDAGGMPDDAASCEGATSGASIGSGCETAGECDEGYACAGGTCVIPCGLPGKCPCPAPTTCGATNECECPVITCMTDTDCGSRGPCFGATPSFPGVCAGRSC